MVTIAVEQTGEITGQVRDDRKQPLPGVTVTLSGASLQGDRAVISGANGGFVFRVLPPGVYSVKFSLAGYQTTELDKLLVNIGRTTPANVDLASGQLTESVTVTAAAPLVDTARTQTQDNYTVDYLEKAQIGSGGRDYLSVIANTAGTGPGDGANFTVRGSTIGQNIYLIDGVDSTDPVTETFGSNFIYDTIQEVQVQTGGFAAEFGRSAGGIVNVVTKSGGNEFSGSVDMRYRDQGFLEKGDHFDPSSLTDKREILETTLGGPVVKDKLWFFLAGSYVRSDTATGGSPTTYQYMGKYYLGKLTWQITPDHNLALQVTGDPSTIDNVDSSALVAPEATTYQVQGSQFVSLRYQGTLTPNLLLQVQGAYYKARLDATPESGDLSTIGLVNFLTGEQTRNAIDAQYSTRYQNQLNATLTWHVPNLAGDHTFKCGVDVQERKFQSKDLAPGGEYDQIAPSSAEPGSALVPLLYNVVLSAGQLENKGLVTGTFVQDDWQVHPGVMLNLGLRYETYSYDNDTGRKVLWAEIPEPRIGVSWDVTGDAKNVLKVYGGRFADPSLLALPTVVNSRANLTNIFVNETIGGWLDQKNPAPVPADVNGDGTIEDRAFYFPSGGPGGEEFAHGGHLKMTNVVEYSASYERQLSPVSAVGLTLVRRKTYDIIEDYYDPAKSIYIIDNIGELDRNHYGAELRFRTKYKRLSLWSSYTWGKSRGNIEYTQSLGSDWDFPVLRKNRYGWLTDDTRHDVRLNGYLDLPLAFQVGFNAQWTSGYPWTTVQSAAPYGDEFVEPRGSQRLPSIWQVDLEFRKAFAIGKTELQISGSVINLFDTEAVTAVNPNVSEAGKPIGWQNPRRYEVGMHYRF